MERRASMWESLVEFYGLSESEADALTKEWDEEACTLGAALTIEELDLICEPGAIAEA